MEVQRYPADYNGIVAASPAINWDRFTVTKFWPQVLMKQTHAYPRRAREVMRSSPGMRVFRIGPASVSG